MKILRPLSTVFPVLLLCSPIALAQDDSGLSAGLQAGTTGFGFQLAAPLSENLTVRGSYNIFSYDTDLDSDDVRYDAEFNKDSLALLLDWHPLSGGFHISGGAYIHNDNTISVLATPAGGTYEFNGTQYDATQIGSVSGNVGFDKTTPYLGLGWGNAGKGTGLSFSADIGVQLQSSPSTSLRAVNCQLSPALCTQLDNDLQAEADQVESDGEDFEYWPVINLGILYHF